MKYFCAYIQNDAQKVEYYIQMCYNIVKIIKSDIEK